MRDGGAGLTRRAMLSLLSAAAAVRPSVARAQRPSVQARVGWLSYLADPDPILERLREGLRELGYVEGKSVVIVPRFADGDFTRLPQLVEDLAGERLDVVVARGPSTDYTKVLRARVPVVFIYSGDPIAAGFADSLSRPGRNMTGITMMALELSAKRMDVLKELLPRATRIALLSNPEHAGELAESRINEEAARRLGASITRYLAQSPQDLATMYTEIRSARPDAMIVFPDSLTLQRRAEIAEFAARERIPTMYGWTEFVESGGLVSYGPRLADNFKTLAKFVDKLLKGANASTLPIEQASRINLTLNMVAARNIGLTVPPTILHRADRIIE
jgi:putative tryptophan/tyrosine transport system substrate-binding protein